MRFALALVAVVAGSAQADTPALVKQYAGRIVISPDPAPTIASELPAYLKANAVAGDRYELIKGSPWEVHLVGFPRDAGATVQLVFVDAGDKLAKPLVTVDVKVANRIVITHAKLTTAAGFEDNKTYAVRLVRGKTVVAKAEVKLRN